MVRDNDTSRSTNRSSGNQADAWQPDNLYWVGVGASAGGLEALRAFIRELPFDLPATYIVAQHTAPLYPSLLSQIIGRETKMNVVDVTDALAPRANCVYIAPPNTNIIVENGKLWLTDPSPNLATPNQK